MNRSVEIDHLTEDRQDAALDTHLDAWTTQEQARHGALVLDLIRSGGWESLKEAVELRIEELRGRVENRSKPFETVGEYEALTGEIRGLKALEAIADGVYLTGAEAERELRDEPD